MYESLSEDEADVREANEPTNTTEKLSTRESVQNEDSVSGGVKVSSKRKRSKCWATFEVIPATKNDDISRARCRKCGYMCAYKSANGTGNMLKHQKICQNTVDIRQMVMTSKSGNMMVRNSIFDPAVFRDLITSVVIRHNLPLHFVEYDGIMEAFLYCHQKATLVSRNTLKSDILAYYKCERKKLFAMLQCFSGRVCLTSDLWTSVATDGYITLTTHFITDDWVLHKQILNFSYFPSPHTGITISEKMYKMLCEWSLEFKLFSITLDNASSNEAFVNTLKTQLNLRNALLNKGEFFHIRCCAHILNLIVQEGLKEMDASVVKIRESVKYIKGSQGRKEKFKECISQVALEKKRGLRQDVPTRWNSTYLMLDSSLYYRRAMTHLKLTDSNYKHGLEEEEWDRVEQICKFLGVFYNVTRLFSGSKYPTANLYFPNVFLVQHTLIKAIEKRDFVANSLAERMKPKFDKYWK